MGSLEARVQMLERQVRRLRLITTVMVLLATVGLTIAATASKEHDRILSKRFVIVGDDGTECGWLQTDREGNPVLLLGTSAHARASLNVTEQGPALALVGRQRSSLSVHISGSGPALAFRGADGWSGGMVGMLSEVDGQGPRSGVRLYTEGTRTVDGGITVAVDGKGPSFMLADRDGNVIHSERDRPSRKPRSSAR